MVDLAAGDATEVFVGEAITRGSLVPVYAPYTLAMLVSRAYSLDSTAASTCLSFLTGNPCTHRLSRQLIIALSRVVAAQSFEVGWLVRSVDFFRMIHKLQMQTRRDGTPWREPMRGRSNWRAR